VTPEIVLVLLIALGAVWLFVTERFRADLVALMVMGALVVTSLAVRFLPWLDSARWLTPEEAIGGFSNPATITVAAMFVLSAGLQRTGALSFVARALRRLSGRPWLLVLAMIVLVATVSAFINNTAAVAVFLPVVLAASDPQRLPPSRLLIPLSYASQFGGVCTLIGTSTNLLVSSLAERAGLGPFGLFEFTPLGLIMLAAGTVYLVAVGRWLLPHRAGTQHTEDYQLDDYIAELRVRPGSPLVGRSVAASGFAARTELTLLEIVRSGKRLFAAQDEPVQVDDILLVQGRPRRIMEARGGWRLELDPEFRLKDEALEATDLRLAEVLVAPGSRLTDRTLAGLEFHRRHRSIVLGLRARQGAVQEKLHQVPLHVGDALLLLAPRDELARLRSDPDFLVLEQIADPVQRRGRIPMALGIVALVVGLAAFNVMPILVSSIVGGIALVVSRCLTLEEAYAAIEWRVIFLLAGVLPLGLALERSGAAGALAEATVNLAGAAGPVVVLATLYFVTAVLTEFMSNNATAVLMAPIALVAATALGVNPRPLLIAVCFAASTSFATPVGYQTNTMVLHPGGYRYSDFVRIGLPLNLLFWVLSVYFIPRFWPF
jgi:di/tricarboxylate transporter